ncbi:formin-binding protein [Polyrhizophydium stewartii]|uniref:Formin-binding protein n=1 Tax=Polyrhizophydium stewartii TaxID=2732419 RepID=A0ABR4N5E1_9FUNG
MDTQKQSFATSFWGEQNRGLEVLLARMKQGKHLCEEVHSMLRERANMEEEYGKRLSKLAKTFNPKDELGTLRESLDVLRTELERSGRAHIDLSAELRSKLEKPLQEFIATQSTIRKSHQRLLEKHLANRSSQEANVAKIKDRLDTKSQESAQLLQMIKQGGTSKEAEKLRQKFEKVSAQARQSEVDYKLGLEKLSETHRVWQADMTAACIDYQKMEEDRFQFIRGNIWNYTNFLSGIYVAEDESCERIRVSLEKCDFEKDLALFLEKNATGSEIPKPPGYIPSTLDDSMSSINGNSANGTVSTMQSSAPPTQASSSASAPPMYSVFSPTDPRRSSTTAPPGSQYQQAAPQYAPAQTLQDRQMLASPPPQQFQTQMPAYQPIAPYQLPQSIQQQSQQQPRMQASSLFSQSGVSVPSGSSQSGTIASTAGGMGGMSSGAANIDNSLHQYNSFDVPESVPILLTVRALYDYNSSAPEELTILKGQIIPVIAKHEDGWWEGLGSEDGRRRKGLFPSNFTEPLH